MVILAKIDPFCDCPSQCDIPMPKWIRIAFNGEPGIMSNDELDDVSDRIQYQYTDLSKKMPDCHPTNTMTTRSFEVGGLSVKYIFG